MVKKRRRRRRLKKGPALILLLIIIGLISLCIYFFYTNTSKYLFFKGLEDSYDNLNSYYENIINNYGPYLNNDYYNNTDTSLVVETDEVKHTINLEGDIYLNSDSNYYDLNINANSIDYDLELLTKDNKLYYKIDNSKYYYINDVEISSFGLNNYNKLLVAFMKSLKSNINSSDLTKEKYTLLIDSKKYSTKKVTLSLTEDKYYKTMISYYEKIKSDEELLECMLNIGDYIDKELLIDYIDISISEYEEKLNNSNDDLYLEYSVYLYKSKPIKNEFIFNDYVFSYIDNSGYVEFNYKETENDYSYIRFNDNKINMFIYGIGYGSGSYSISSFEIDFVDYDEKSLGFISYSIDENGDKYNTSLDLNIDLELLDISLFAEGKIEVDKRIPSIDVSNSVSSSNMTGNDLESLENLLSVINDIIAF